MTLAQKERSLRSPQKDSQPSPEQSSGASGTSVQEEQAWESAIANSIEAIRELADKARAEHNAGRTKKITL